MKLGLGPSLMAQLTVSNKSMLTEAGNSALTSSVYTVGHLHSKQKMVIVSKRADFGGKESLEIAPGVCFHCKGVSSFITCSSSPWRTVLLVLV